jgi:hypothetical protein
LNVALVDLSAKGLNQLFRLTHLEKLEYSIKTGCNIKDQAKEKYNSTFIFKCLENLPNLKMLYHEMDMNSGLAKFHKKHSNKKSKIEKIHLEKSLDIPPKHIPYVKEVFIEGPQVTCSKKLAMFTHLQALETSDMSSGSVMTVLTAVGHQLKQLKITNTFYDQVCSF